MKKILKKYPTQVLHPELNLIQVNSNSEGNCNIWEVETKKGTINIMIDCGLPFTRIKPFLPKKLDLLIITHKHGDHLGVASLNNLLKKYPKMMVMTNGSVMNKWVSVVNDKPTYSVQKDRFTIINNYQKANGVIAGLDLNITAIPVEHGDSRTSSIPNHSYLIAPDGEKGLVFCTDTGNMLELLKHEELKGQNIYLLETNYSMEVLEKNMQDKVEQCIDVSHEVSARRNHTEVKTALHVFDVLSDRHSVLVPAHISSSNY